MTWFRIFLVASAIIVGMLHIGPPLAIRAHLAERGQPFVLDAEANRDTLFYAGRAREIYDGHYPPTDLHFPEQLPTVLNPLPSLTFAGIIALSGGNVTTAYLIALFLFSGIGFLLFYYLGRILFTSRMWALFFAYVAILTPIAFRILNFNGA